MKIGINENGLPITERATAKHGAILNLAVAIAASEGLNALTIGRLASCLNMSRSGIFSHFDSKEALQLEVLDWAYRLFEAEVISPAYQSASGMPQVKSFVEGLFRYHSENCFLTHVSAEFDSRDGEVKDKIVEIHRRLLQHLETMLQTAGQNNQIHPLSDEAARGLAFEILAMFMGSQILFQLRVVPDVVAIRWKHLKRLFADLLTENNTKEVTKWLR